MLGDTAGRRDGAFDDSGADLLDDFGILAELSVVKELNLDCPVGIAFDE